LSNVTLTLYDARTIRVPVYGQIAAGKPLDDSPIIGWRQIRRPRDYKPGQRYCAVIVNGVSLQNAGILNGDHAILRMQRTINRTGQLAAILLPDGLTLKYIYPDGAGVRLEGASLSYRPQWYPADDVSIQAIVIRIERDL